MRVRALLLFLLAVDLREGPWGAVGGLEESVGFGVAEGLAHIVVDQAGAGAGGDVAQVGELGAEAAVADGAGRFQIACTDAFKEVPDMVCPVLVVRSE